MFTRMIKHDLPVYNSRLVQRNGAGVQSDVGDLANVDDLHNHDRSSLKHKWIENTAKPK